MASRELEGRRNRGWGADSDSSEAEGELVNSQTGRYQLQDAWSESLNVERGSAPVRIDLKHGFHKHIVGPHLPVPAAFQAGSGPSVAVRHAAASCTAACGFILA